uniref:Uncharacterized protein n=1 Tax=Rangifer tarandus platyrhynchus TaxID=3082113 RepID=A0ACB0F694_RANTA|nr:unnamed protein product [Rangifer tarandus platyrhynchus]
MPSTALAAPRQVVSEYPASAAGRPGDLALNSEEPLGAWGQNSTCSLLGKRTGQPVSTFLDEGKEGSAHGFTSSAVGPSLEQRQRLLPAPPWLPCQGTPPPNPPPLRRRLQRCSPRSVCLPGLSRRLQYLYVSEATLSP